MKKSFMIAAVLIFSIISGESVFALQKKDPHKRTNNNPAGITYIVEITGISAGDLCHDYQVVMTDANGTPVCMPIMFQAGISNYVFHESGPVNETRIAQLLEVYTPGQTACEQTIYIEPHEDNKNFQSGSTYHFLLQPLVLPGND